MYRFFISILSVIIMISSSCKTADKTGPSFTWSQLLPTPDKVGFAGAFAGVSNDHLIVAGGSQFPEGTRPWSGGVKFWNDKIFALANNADNWKEIGRLPQPMGYGISLSWNNGVLLIGGADQTRHFKNVYFLTYDNEQLLIDTLPSLPNPLANACGAIINNKVYVAGGLSSPGARTTENIFWALDLGQPKKVQRWEILPGWPGESRMLSVAGAIGEDFYLISGASLYIPSGDSVAHRRYLTDAYVFNRQKGWKKIKDLPHPVAAAPTPAYTGNDQQLSVFGGDDGSRAEQNAILKDQHPGFLTEIITYNAQKDEWLLSGNVFTNKRPNPEQDPAASTWAPVTTPLVLWNKKIVIPQGEARPGVRTNRVLVADPEPGK